MESGELQEIFANFEVFWPTEEYREPVLGTTFLYNGLYKNWFLGYTLMFFPFDKMSKIKYIYNATRGGGNGRGLQSEKSEIASSATIRLRKGRVFLSLLRVK
ncbi:MAG: hypothetical protein FWG77_08285 [Treponema sp.]|nr:hypothetical protein [Treponema sp.]